MTHGMQAATPRTYWPLPPSWTEPLGPWFPLLWDGLVLLLAALVGRLLATVVFRLLQRWAKSTESVIDDSIGAHLDSPLRYLLPLVALNVAYPIARLPDHSLTTVFTHGTLVATFVCGGWAIIGAVRVIEEGVNDSAIKDDTPPAEARAIRTRTSGFRNIASFIVTIIALGFVLMSFERVRQIGAGLLASAGVAGIVLGFAAQRTLATLLAGIQIAVTQPIKVNDVVIVEGEWGTIEELTLTYVVVRIWDKRRLIVPITHFIDKPVQNWTRGSADLLGTVELHLDYGVPLGELRAELRRVCEASDHWDGEVCGIQVTGATERTMLVRPLVSAADAGKLWELRCEVREALIDFVQRHHPWALPRLRTELPAPPSSAEA